MISRRNFLAALGLTGIAGMAGFNSSCSTEKKIQGKLLGPNATLGHRLRTLDMSSLLHTTPLEKHVVIVGGGISGLSAAWQLRKHNIDFVLIELEDNTGGNAASGKNQFSAYPWGAHYLPLPNTLYPELTRFLEDIQVITGWKNNLPVYDEYCLCFEPKERLYIHEQWQEGLLPLAGVPEKDREEIIRFTKMMDDYKHAKGADGKEAFCIPVDFSSTDEKFTSLDSLSLNAFLKENNFASPYLKWYVDYCCSDDFGATSENISAWAGIHYFSSRKGEAANASSDTVLTWPEGNAFLAEKMRKTCADAIVPGSLVFNVDARGEKVEVSCFNEKENQINQFSASHVILATPQFINQRILKYPDDIRNTGAFSYSPWVVANITTNATLEEKRGEPLSWDNVIYGSRALGYVNATHQHLARVQNEKVITYYLPLTNESLQEARKRALSEDFNKWVDIILSDLKRPHPTIAENIISMDIWRWGHGMIIPSIGFMWSADRSKAAGSIDGRVHFAHSDLSGISIFEESFYRGTEAAKKIIAAL